MSRNIGEENEVFLKAFLLMMFNNKKPILGDHNIGSIKSLKFSPEGKLPVWKKKYEILIKKRDYSMLKKIFIKAPMGSKADLEINGIRYSVKNSLGAKSAIVNHTNRLGFLRVLDQLNLDIKPHDKIIDEYWNKRADGEIMEDINNRAENSPFAKHKEYLKPIIEYFLFTGAGAKDSVFPADKVLLFGNPEDPISYKILSKSEAVDGIWDDLTFSMRSKKGMPNIYDSKKHKDLASWVRFHPRDSDFPKGALHIRS